MKVIVVGGTGVIGGRIALHLRSRGHDVALSARSAPAADGELGDFSFIACDYAADPPDAAVLAGQDALVFAAGNDPRHLPPETDADGFYDQMNVKAVPAFIAAARDAGVVTAIQIGSYYPHVVPNLIERSSYVRSRHLADEAACALDAPGFRSFSINAPFVAGAAPWLDKNFLDIYVRYARGEFDIPVFAPPGGSNFISSRSVAEAVEGALARGEGGKSYLIGDENLTFQSFFQLLFDAVGAGKPVPVEDREHPLLPDASLFAGRGTELFYEPDPRGAALLGYGRGNATPAIRELAACFLADHGF